MVDVDVNNTGWSSESEVMDNSQRRFMAAVAHASSIAIDEVSGIKPRVVTLVIVKNSPYYKIRLDNAQTRVDSYTYVSLKLGSVLLMDDNGILYDCDDDTLLTRTDRMIWAMSNNLAHLIIKELGPSVDD